MHKPLILVTGASRGIGRFLLDSFRSEGHTVIGIFNSNPPEIHQDCCHQVDLTQFGEVKAFVAKHQFDLHNVVLLNAAGITYNALAHKAKIEDWMRVMNTNVGALFNLTSLLLPVMREEGYGRVVNFASVVAQAGVAGTSAYAASKSALWGLSRALAVENAAKGITINNINLGYFDIGMIEQVPGPILEFIVQKIPAKRLGKPSEILSTVKYIIDTPYLNGTAIDLNGGLY